MIQLPIQPAPQPQPAAGPGVTVAVSDGTGFMVAFETAPPDRVAPMMAPAGSPAAPDDPEPQDPASAVAAGPVVLWLGAAMADAPYVRPPALGTPTPEARDSAAAPAALGSASPRADEFMSAVPEGAVAVAGAVAVVSAQDASATTDPSPTATPANSDRRWTAADQASPLAPLPVTDTATDTATDGRGADPAPTVAAAAQSPGTTRLMAPVAGPSGAVSGRSQPLAGVDRHAAGQPLRTMSAPHATGLHPLAAMNAPGGSPHHARTVAPPLTQARAASPTTVPTAEVPTVLPAVTGRAASPTTVPTAEGQKPLSAAALGGKVGQSVTGRSDRPVAVNAAPGMNPATPHTAVRERPPVAAPMVPQALPAARVNRLQNPFAGAGRAIFLPPMPPAPDQSEILPPAPVAPPPALVATTQAGGIVPAAAPAADPSGAAVAGLSRGDEQTPLETPAPAIETGDRARNVTAPGAKSKSPYFAQVAAPDSGLPPATVTAIRPNAPDLTVPIAAPAPIGAKPEFSGQPRLDEAAATAQADGPTPSPAADRPAPTGEPGPTLAQILATPVTTVAPASASAFTPHSRPLAATLIEHVRNGRAESVELSLAPEGLGHLRLSLQPEGDVMRVLISAERPETVDLMRRHADQLAQEFRQAGYAGATLSFGQWGTGGAAHPPAQAPAQANPQAAATTVANPSLTASPPGAQEAPEAGGLDLRL